MEPEESFDLDAADVPDWKPTTGWQPDEVLG